MKKLFTILAATLLSVSMFAADYTPAVTSVYTVGDATTLGSKWASKNQNANYFAVADTVVFSPFINYASNGDSYQPWTGSTGGSSTDATWDAKDCFRGSTAWFSSSPKAATVRTTRFYLYNVTNCTEVKALLKSSGTIKMTLAAYEITGGAVSTTAAQSTEFTNTSIGVATIKNLDAAKTYQVKVISDNTNNTLFYEIAFVHPHPCNDPEAHLTFTKSTAYVGEQFSYNYSSKNGGALNDSYTLNGDPAVQGTDYTFSSGNLTVLKAGQFVMHRTVDAQGDFCAVDVSDTILISEATPVESVTIGEAAHTARMGGSVTLTATAANATEWQWALNGEDIDGAESNSYTFTATATGTFNFVCKARNDFNLSGETPTWVPSEVHAITVAKSSDATLSDLKVNGETVDGFAADKFVYNLGEIGVYEKPALTYTVNDEGYANAVLKQNILTDGADSVVVTSEDSTTVNNYVITYTRAAASELAEISINTTWDFTKTGTTEIKLTDASLPTKIQEFVYADMLTNPDASFKAGALAGIQEYVVRDGKYCQGQQLRFVTTVNGSLEVVYCNTGNRAKKEGETEGQEALRRFLTINGNLVTGDAGSMKSSENTTTSNIAVNAGAVVIGGAMPYRDDEKDPAQPEYLRIHKVVFTVGWPTAVDNTVDNAKAIKTIENGQLVIIKNGVKYNVLGTVVR